MSIGFAVQKRKGVSSDVRRCTVATIAYSGHYTILWWSPSHVPMSLTVATGPRRRGRHSAKKCAPSAARRRPPSGRPAGGARGPRRRLVGSVAAPRERSRDRTLRLEWPRARRPPRLAGPLGTGGRRVLPGARTVAWRTRATSPPAPSWSRSHSSRALAPSAAARRTAIRAGLVRGGAGGYRRPRGRRVRIRRAAWARGPRATPARWPMARASPNVAARTDRSAPIAPVAT